MGFVSLGLPDGLLGVAWPSIRDFFGVPLESLGVLLLVFTSGYLVSSFSTGYILTRVSPGNLLAGCALAMSISLLGYSLSVNWWMLVGFAVIGGLGAGALDAVLNTVAATNYSARVVNWLHASYGIGATVGPVIMTSVLISGWRWQWVYGVLAIAQMVLVASFVSTRSRWRISDTSSTTPQAAVAASSIATLKLPIVWIRIVLFAVYTGIEVTAGQWTFSLLTEGRGISVGTAGTWISFYWGALTIGRIGLGMFAGLIPVNQLLRICISGAAFGSMIFWLDLGLWPNFASLIVIGLCLGPVFPSLIAATPSQVGRAHTPNTIGFQITAAALGGGLIPAFVGLLVGISTLEAVSLSLLAGTLVLFALYEGTQLRRRRDYSHSNS